MLSYKEIEVPDAREFRNVSVVEVLVADGEQIEVGTPLITVKNDQGLVDLPSPMAGKVQEVIVQVQDRISKGTSILLLETEVADPVPAEPAAAEPPAADFLSEPEPVPEERHPTRELGPAPSAPATADGAAHPSGITINVPDIGDFEGVEVIEVHVKPGDAVRIEDPLITLESDKATMDVPSPLAGIIQHVHVQLGDHVSQDSPIVDLGSGSVDAEETSQPRLEEAVPETQTAAPPNAPEVPSFDAGPGARIEPSLKPDLSGGDEPEAHHPSRVEPTLAPPRDDARIEPTAETAADEPGPQQPSPAPAPQEPDDGDGAETVTVSVPDIGDFQGVEVIEVLVKAGDGVRLEDPLITLESDKATMDVPSPVAGSVVHVHVQVGDRVSEGSAIADVRASAAQAPEVKEEEREAEPPALPPPPEVQRSVAPPPPPVREEKPAPPPPVVTETPVGGPSAPPATPGGEVPAAELPHASPGVRRFARELGVDLGRVAGSGPKGRILKQDVQKWVKQELAKPAPAPAPAAPTGTGIPEMPDIDFSQFGEIETRPLSRIKKRTAANLTRAWLHVPHVTQHDEADITELEEFRQDLKKEQEAKGGARITMLSFLMKACVVALKEFPNFNASLEKGGENLIVKRYYHIGIAVDTDEGLVVPVVKDVDRKTIRDLAGELGDISARARDKKLSPKDLQGASFTISSLGGIGGTAFTPIVNAPEVAILGVSKSSMKPVYDKGGFVPRLILPISLSYDHRVIDGAEAARFTSFLANVLADVRRLLL